MRHTLLKIAAPAMGYMNLGSVGQAAFMSPEIINKNLVYQHNLRADLLNQKAMKATSKRMQGFYGSGATLAKAQSKSLIGRALKGPKKLMGTPDSIKRMKNAINPQGLSRLDRDIRLVEQQMSTLKKGLGGKGLILMDPMFNKKSPVGKILMRHELGHYKDWKTKPFVNKNLGKQNLKGLLASMYTEARSYRGGFMGMRTMKPFSTGDKLRMLTGNMKEFGKSVKGAFPGVKGKGWLKILGKLR